VFAYEYAVSIKNIMPFQTTKELMSSKEFLLSQIPDASWFTVWGCKASVLEPRTEGRKDFHGKTVIGFMAGFSAGDNPMAYKIYVPELSGVVYSTNVVFDQNIPPPSESYHQELRAVVVRDGPRMRLADVEAQILNKTFKDDEYGLLYDVKRVRILKDRTMVADIALHGTTKKLRTPMHVADIIRMIQAMDVATPSTVPLHRAIQERDDETHESALYLESLSQPQHPFGVIPASVDDIPTMTKTCKSPYGELSLASGDVACKVSRHDSKSPYGELSLASGDVACEVSRQECKSPYGEPSLLPDIEHDCSRMSGSELRQTRQYLEHSSAYSHLQDSAVKTCLEHCSTLNYTERDSGRKCLVAHEVLGDEENTPSTAGSATSKDTCMFVEDPIDAWVQNDPTRGADRHTPFVHPNFVETLLTQSTHPKWLAC
jgi:hypothetical protein